jgi:hypothetical protein
MVTASIQVFAGVECIFRALDYTELTTFASLFFKVKRCHNITSIIIGFSPNKLGERNQGFKGSRVQVI